MKKLLIILTVLLIAAHGLPLFAQLQELTDREQADLFYTLEEQKLATELYATFQEEWHNPLFHHAVAIEKLQLTAAGREIQRHNLELPVRMSMDIRGEFSIEEVQALQKKLMPKMEISEVEGMIALAALEETQIKRLDEAISNTEDINIIILYDRIRVSSKKHLIAICKALAEQDIPYHPVTLTEKELEDLVDTVL